jgi:hypothetical protein
MGVNAGYSATNAESNFIGNNVGFQASSANNSNFIGSAAGYNASGAYSSNFFGQAGSGSNKCGSIILWVFKLVKVQVLITQISSIR